MSQDDEVRDELKKIRLRLEPKPAPPVALKPRNEQARALTNRLKNVTSAY